jgi:AmiR/NasT family two-component response regulator
MAEEPSDLSDTFPEDVPEHPTRVLVAEDEHLVAVDISQNLRGLGFEVIGPAANGEQAVELAKEQAPDLALLDIRMPVMDGLAAAGVLFCQMGIPVVILTAFSDQEYIQASTRIGVFGYMLKPVTPDELRVNIAVAWSRYVQHSRLRGEVRDLKLTLEHRKIIERAKGLLMEKLNITEDMAMKRLQKQARDSRRKLVDLARSIIEANELLSGGDNSSPGEKSSS